MTVGARATKDALRAMITNERRRRPAAESRRAAQGLRDVFLELPLLRSGPRVGVYVSHRGELGTQLLRAALAARGVCVVLPVISATGEVRWLPDTMSFPEPLPLPRDGARRRRKSAPADVEIVLVPALAVDTCGRRLGRGRDHYDLLLSQLGPTTLVIGAVHDDELLDAAVEPVPDEPHDVPVDAVITPTRILYLPRASATSRHPMPTAAA